MLQSLFYLTIAVHVSVIIITHLQEHKFIIFININYINIYYNYKY
jgi:hypothetical protein